jgi:GNAT superfamily N-acetyltransferase
MSRLELRPFAEEDVAPAGVLLAARHRRQRQCEPLLAGHFEEPAAAQRQVAALWSAADVAGSVAVTQGRVVGFLLGAPKGVAEWGPNMWVEAAGHAVDGDAEMIRDLYGLAASRWVEEGRTAHYVVVPVSEPTWVDAWFHVGFGLQHVHAIREAAAVGSPEPVEGVVIRRSRQEDIPALAALDLELPAHQAQSPVFSAGVVPTLAEAEAEWVDALDDSAFAAFTAEQAGAVLGAAVGCSIEKSSTHIGLSRADDAGFLGWAVVSPEARGRGVGRALAETVISWAAAAGYRSVVTDWRATNLLSSRTWPRLGFRPTFLRLHRVVGY